MAKPFRIAPSILSANFAKLGQEITDVISAGADVVHFDVMDNHYVPNLTIGPLVCEAIRPVTDAIIDVHLMVKPVDRIIPDFAKAGANIITFHPEASDHIDRSLSLVREHGCKSGLVFNPATPLDYLDYVMDKVDMVLLMSVNPGFGGQKFIPGTLDKLRHARAKIDAYTEKTGREIWLEIDGGVNVANIADIARAGADTFVAGSAIFGAGNDHTAPDLALAANLMLAELDRPLVAEPVIRTYVGNGAARLIKRLLTGEMDGEPEAGLFERAQTLFYRYYADALDVHTRLYPGVLDALQTLSQAGFRLACITNKPQQFTLPLLQTMGLYRYFDLGVGGAVLDR